MKQLIIAAVIIASISSYSLAMKYTVNINNDLSNETISIYDTGNGRCAMGRKNRELLCSIGPKQQKSINFSTMPIVFTTKTMKTLCLLQMKEAPKSINFTYHYRNGEDCIDIFCDNKFNGWVENKPHFPNK